MNEMWIPTTKGDQRAREIADRHYTRQSIGSVQFCRPGKNLVFVLPDYSALWVSWWSPYRKDSFSGYECTIFRNESLHLSSSLIREAVEQTYETWGPAPFITYVKSEQVASSNPGYCYTCAGWKKEGFSRKRNYVKLIFE